jgi:hypothetical protein
VLRKRGGRMNNVKRGRERRTERKMQKFGEGVKKEIEGESSLCRKKREVERGKKGGRREGGECESW